MIAKPLLCRGCKTMLMKRRDDGVLDFRYGHKKGVEMRIHGSVRLKCWKCECVNVFNYFADVGFNQPEAEVPNSQDDSIFNL